MIPKEEILNQENKILMLKDTILDLYTKEGRGKRYIADLLRLNYRKLVYYLEKVWFAVKADKKHLTPSVQKRLNNWKESILNMLASDVPIKDIENKTKIRFSSILEHDADIKKAMCERQERIKNQRILRDKNKVSSLRELREHPEKIFENIDFSDEEWEVLLGYECYSVSNKGRVKNNLTDRILKPVINIRSGYVYADLNQGLPKRKMLALHRLVARAFVEGYSEENNTVNHKDGNSLNNQASNLEWISQKENNIHKYLELEKGNSYTKIKPFKKIIYNGYKFSTVVALAKFMGISKATCLRKIYDKKLDISFIY